MKIFISHSSRQKLFVKELKKYMPEHINLWIDEKELLVGENFGNTIQGEIKNKCDFLIIIIDNQSVKSDWVLREFEWSLIREQILGRAFILPVVLELEAWQQITDVNMKNRKYLQCLDFTDESIKNLGHNLILELFGWLSKQQDGRFVQGPKKLGDDDILKRADLYSAKLADQIRLQVYPYRRAPPP